MNKKNKTRLRLDQLLVERGFFASRHQAQGVILSGNVLVDGRVIDKAGAAVDVEAGIELAKLPQFVSRAGDKLASALDHFAVDVSNKVALDAGISTGGFTDCLLQRHVAKVYGIDVAYGQVAWNVRQDPRLVLIERTNVRHLFDAAVERKLAEQEIHLRGAVDLLTLDLSFIGLCKVLPTVIKALKEGGVVLAMVKPQFELEKDEIGKGGIVRDPLLQQKAVEKVVQQLVDLGCHVRGSVASAVKGAQGNQEFFVLAEFGGYAKG